MAALKVCVAGLILYWLVSSGKFDPTALKRVGRFEIWAAGVGIFLVALAVNTLRWREILSFQKVNLSFSDAYRLSLIGIFFNFVIPGGVGGDVVKVSYLFRRYPQKKLFVGWGTFIDRIFGVSALLVYAGLSGIFFHQTMGADVGPSVFLLSATILTGAFVGVMVLLFAPRNRLKEGLERFPSLAKIFSPLFVVLSQPQKIIRPILLSFMGQFLMISIVAVLGFLLGETIPWNIYFILVPLGILTTIVPITPAGLGIGQAAYFFLFETVVGRGEFGVLAITFQQAVQFLVGLLGGLLFVLYDKSSETIDHG